MTVLTTDQVTIPKELLEVLLSHPDTEILLEEHWKNRNRTGRDLWTLDIKIGVLEKCYSWSFEWSELEAYCNMDGGDWIALKDHHNNITSDSAKRIAVDFCILNNWHQAEDTSDKHF